MTKKARHIIFLGHSSSLEIELQKYFTVSIIEKPTKMDLERIKSFDLLLVHISSLPELPDLTRFQNDVVFYLFSESSFDVSQFRTVYSTRKFIFRHYTSPESNLAESLLYFTDTIENIKQPLMGPDFSFELVSQNQIDDVLESIKEKVASDFDVSKTFLQILTGSIDEVIINGFIHGRETFVDSDGQASLKPQLIDYCKSEKYISFGVKDNSGTFDVESLTRVLTSKPDLSSVIAGKTGGLGLLNSLNFWDFIIVGGFEGMYTKINLVMLTENFSISRRKPRKATVIYSLEEAP